MGKLKFWFSFHLLVETLGAEISSCYLHTRGLGIKFSFIPTFNFRTEMCTFVLPFSFHLLAIFGFIRKTKVSPLA